MQTPIKAYHFFGDTLRDGSPVPEDEVTVKVDATGLLQVLARQCALEVVDLWDAPDVFRRYLETGDETLKSEALDAWNAARDARDPAWTRALAAQRKRFNEMVAEAFKDAR